MNFQTFLESYDEDKDIDKAAVRAKEQKNMAIFKETFIKTSFRHSLLISFTMHAMSRYIERCVNNVPFDYLKTYLTIVGKKLITLPVGDYILLSISTNISMVLSKINDEAVTVKTVLPLGDSKPQRGTTVYIVEGKQFQMVDGIECELIDVE